MIDTIKRAIDILNSYDSDSVKFVSEYKDEIDHLRVVELRWPDLVEVDPQEEIANIRHNYLMYGIGEDYVDSVEDFDRIYKALCCINS